MANSIGTETPPAPDSSLGNALMNGSGGVPQGPQQAPSQGAGPQQQGQPQQPSPPTAAQTVAALRHFDATKKELGILLADPALGKTNVKSKIISGVVRLVASGMMKTTEAVTELSKVPTDPLMQMKWAKSMFQQAQTAENAILDQYGATSPHLGTVADHFASTQGVSDPGDHLDHLAALRGNYGKAA
jgi:hypothetical protein